jgi:pilus assembly protein Flp/PilA
MSLIGRFVRDEGGITAIEYALMGGLIALALIVGATALGTQLNIAFDTVEDKIPAG